MRDVIAAMITWSQVRTSALYRQDIVLKHDIDVIGPHACNLGYDFQRLIGLIDLNRWPPDASPATPHSPLACEQ
jgi:hypothetical protein